MKASYLLEGAAALKELGVDPGHGLSANEVIQRRQEHGTNELPRGKKKHWWQLLFRQFKSPLVYILVVAAIITSLMHEWVDTIIIMAAVSVNVAVGFWQEFQSSNILEKLQQRVRMKAQVRRDGELCEVDAADLVPGDIIVVRAGTKVPADARLIEARELHVDESLLTGESIPVKKNIAVLAEDVPVGDRSNMIHMGSVVEKGEGAAVVVRTGGQTEIGKIALLTQSTEEIETPLQKRIGKLGMLLTIFVMVATVVIFIIGLFEDHEFHEMFTTAVAVAVAAIPEGLPAAISIILAVSSQRILKRKGIIKQLVAAETLGSATVICADKTGTLTEGEMKVELIIADGAEKAVYEVMALANEGLIERKEGKVVATGEATDRAKLEAYQEHVGSIEELYEKYDRLAIVPFDSKRKYIASFHEKENGVRIAVAGAPEELMRISTYIIQDGGSQRLTEDHRSELHDTYEEMAKQGYRMIALAERRLEAVENVEDAGDDELAQYVQDMVFLGFAAIRDPIRNDVQDTIAAARGAGIRVMMLTGDHKLTALSIGGELGLVTNETAVLEGSEIDAMSDDELADRIKAIEICARVSPEHKMRIIRALKTHDEVVAMTGDGVNDAPALKAADIGVALGSGTDVAKEASDLVLLNNSLTTIVAAIKQGRIAFDNIRKVTVFLLASSFTEIILVLSSLVFRIELALLGRHILFTNLVEDALPNVSLAFEPGEKDVLKRKPIDKNEPILDGESKAIVFAIGIITDIILVGVFIWLYRYYGLHLVDCGVEGACPELALVRTVIFAALGTDTSFYIFSIKSLHQPIYKYNIFNNKLLVGAVAVSFVAMGAAIYVPFFYQNLLLAPLPFKYVMLVLALGLFKLFLIEMAKWWFVHRDDMEDGYYTDRYVAGSADANISGGDA